MRNSPRTRKLEQILCDSTHLPGAGTFHVHALARGQPPGPYSCMHYTLHAPRAHGHASCVIRSVGCPAILSVQSDQKSMCALGAGPHDPPLPRVGISPQVLPRPSVIPTMPTCLRRLHAPWPSHARALTVSLPMPLDARPRRGSMQPRRARSPAALCRSPHLALDGAKFMSSAKRSSGWNSSISGACGMWHSSVAFIPFIIAPISRFPMPMWFVIKLNILYCPL